MNEDPHLRELVIDRDAVDTARLAAGLRGIVGIDDRSGEVFPGESFAGLRTEGKLVALLLGRLAAHLLGRQPDDRLAVKELITISGLPRGTVAPAIRRLLTERRLVAQDADKRYSILRSAILPALELIELR